MTAGRVFPIPELRTERVGLRPFSRADVPAVAGACSDPETQKWLPLASPYTTDVAAQWCGALAEDLRAAGDGLNLAYVDPAGRLGGSVSLKRTDWRAAVTEIGYWAVPSMRGRGLTTAAVAMLSSWALQNGMERVELRVSPANTGSIRVAERAGFELEGLLRNAGFTHQGRTDLLCFSVVNALEPSAGR